MNHVLSRTCKFNWALWKFRDIYIYDYRLTKLAISRISRVNPLGWADCRVN